MADLVGNTPLVRLRSVTRDLSPAVEIYAKLEYFNPGGSVKDRSALQMMRNALAAGDLPGFLAEHLESVKNGQTAATVMNPT